MTIIITVGSLLILLGILVAAIMKNSFKDELKFMTPRFVVVGIISCVLGLILAQSIFYAKAGHQYHIVSPFGKKYTVFTSGWKFSIPGSKIQEWQKNIDIKVLNEGESSEGIEGVIHGGIPVRFIDQVTGEVYVTVRVSLPQDPQQFLDLVETFRSPQNLTDNTLVPTVREQTINTGYMFAAQDYISGSAQEFRQTLDEQLKAGAYQVERQVYYDTIYSDIQTLDDRGVKEIKTRYEVVRKLDSTGHFLRIPNEISTNSLLVTQVIVEGVILEADFRKRLEAQRDIAAQKQLELEKIEQAKISQQLAQAEGERDKTTERLAREKEQVQVLISEETKLKQARTQLELSKVELERQRLEAEKERVAADAQAYANSRLVRAGLTPQQEAEIEKEKAVEIAKAIGGPNGVTLPQYYMVGGEGNSQTDMVSQLLLMMMANQNNNGANK